MRRIKNARGADAARTAAKARPRHPARILTGFALAAGGISLAAIALPDRTPHFGQATGPAVDYQSAVAETIEIEIAPVMIDGRYQTPTWAQLQRAYKISDNDLQVLLDQHNAALNAGQPQSRSAHIPAGTTIVIAVNALDGG